jgi:hypothetical protein
MCILSYYWDGRKAAAGGTLYDFLRVSWLSAGTLEAPAAETTLFEREAPAATYGANMNDDDANYLSLDEAMAALPATEGTLIVRRGVFDPAGAVVVYEPNSAVLRAFAVAGTGTALVGNLSGNANIPENVEGAVSLDSNSLTARVVLSPGAFGVRYYNWCSADTPTYNYLVVCQLDGSPGAFTAVAVQYAFPMLPPDSPTGFVEIPLPQAANGVSFVLYAATESGVGMYTLYPDSFPLGTAYGTDFEDLFGFSEEAPYAVSDLAANVLPGLPSAAGGVLTVLDDTRQIILGRSALTRQA